MHNNVPNVYSLYHIVLNMSHTLPYLILKMTVCFNPMLPMRDFPGGSDGKASVYDVKRLSTMWETWVRSLDREESLEKEMATDSSTLA